MILRTWVNDPKVALFYDGSALAGNLAANKVTLINAKNEAISLFFDVDTNLPIKKTYSWRDPVEHQKVAGSQKTGWRQRRSRQSR